MKHILDFCHCCGVLIQAGVGTLPKSEQTCESCGSEVSTKDQRIQGVFEEKEAVRLRLALGQA